MATYFRVIEPGRQFFDANGAVLAGGLINTYDPGTTTPKTCYQDNAGASSHANPIVLDAAGRLPAAVWTTTGGVKLVVTTAAAGAIFTEDDVEGVNDVSANSASEWTASGLTPTRTGDTTFTVPGDATTEFHYGRRLRCTDSSVRYGFVLSAVYSSVTTVTVVLDTGTLTPSLSAVSYGLTSLTNTSIPYVGAQAGAAATLASNHTQTAGANAWENIPLDTETGDATNRFDIGSHFASNAYTAPAAGWYLCTGRVSINSLANDEYVQSGITVDGTLVSYGTIVDNGGAVQSLSSVTGTLFLAAGEVVRLQGRTSATSGSAYTSGVPGCYLNIVRIA